MVKKKPVQKEVRGRVLIDGNAVYIGSRGNMVTELRPWEGQDVIMVIGLAKDEVKEEPDQTPDQDPGGDPPE